MDVRESESGRVGKDAHVASLQGLESPDDRSGRLGLRALGGDRRKKRDLAVRLETGPAPLQELKQVPRRPLPGHRPVDVRIGPIGDERIRESHHRIRDVGVIVEAGDDRHVGSDRRAHPPQQLALAILDVLGDHGAVKVEVNGVERFGCLEVVDQPSGDRLEGAPGDVAAWHRRAEQHGHQLVPAVASRFGKPGQRNVEAGNGVEHSRTPDEWRERPAALQEILKVGLDRGEGVGFVLESSDREPRHQQPRFGLRGFGGRRCPQGLSSSPDRHASTRFLTDAFPAFPTLTPSARTRWRRPEAGAVG